MAQVSLDGILYARTEVRLEIVEVFYRFGRQNDLVPHFGYSIAISRL